MKQIIGCVFILLILLIMILYFNKESFTNDSTFDNNISEIEKKIKSLEHAMSSMKHINSPNLTSNNQKKPYKTVYNYY